jgi:hypothetical protein
VRRLLNLVIDPNSLEELARQDRYDRDFLTDEARRQAYPFNEGLEHRHNLVTLLAWADYLGVTPAEPNRFFQAKAARRLHRIEADRRHTMSFSLCWPARILSGMELVLVFPIAIFVLAAHPGLLRHPFGWWTLFLYFGLGFLLVGLNIRIGETIKDLPETSRAKRYLYDGAIGDESSDFLLGSGNCLTLIPNYAKRQEVNDGIIGWTFLALPVSTIPMATISLIDYIVLTLGAATLFSMTNLRAFGSEIRYYLYRPNEYVDVYDDPRSRHWLVLCERGFVTGSAARYGLSQTATVGGWQRQQSGS